MNYSSSIKQVGRFRVSKLFKIFGILFSIVKCRIDSRIDVFYYPPSGPHRIPLYRDIITLLFARMFAKKIILHFHAGGLSDKIERLNPVERFFAYSAFRHVDAAIVLLPWLEKEVQWFRPKNVFIVPNGIEDVAGSHSPVLRSINEVCNILFVGNLKDEKGIFVLLSAAKHLKVSNRRFQLQVMGDTHSESLRVKIDSFIADNDLQDCVKLLGSISGSEKWNYFRSAHVFCLPTYDTEAMPVSILEAMMFSLPTVTSKWRAIPDMIADKKEAFFCEIKEYHGLADKLAMFIDSPGTALQVGTAARARFKSQYTIGNHLQNMERVFEGFLKR